MSYLKKYEYVIAIAKEGGISQAAEELHVAQPTLSKYIKKLEAELGVELFDRSTIPLTLTEAGERFIEVGKQLLDIERQLQKQLQEIKSDKNRVIRIGISPSRSPYLMPSILTRYRDKKPEGRIVIKERNTSELIQMLSVGELDLMISLLDEDSANFERIDLFEEEILLTLSKNLCTGTESVSELLRSTPLISVGQGLTLWQIMDRLTDSLTITKPAIECQSIESALALVRQGLGAMLVPSYVARYGDKRQNKDLCFFPLSEEQGIDTDLSYKRNVCLFYRREQFLTQSEKDFIACVQADVDSGIEIIKIGGAMIPSALIYLGIMLVFIVAWFMWLKRPIYEALFLSFILLVAITGTWTQIWTYIDGALSTSLLYSMIVFVAMSQLLTHTKVIDSCIFLILSLFGRIRGGAGYASILASSFMGALSGSGPGNVMATGVITIPAMKKSGFPAELAANVESTASYLGNMIPPSSNIVGALGAYATYCLAIGQENTVTSGQFWVILWGIAVYFILQRVIMLWCFCKYYKVQPMEKEDIPSLKETFKIGWKGLLLPVIILVPFIFDSLLSDTFITARLGESGASAFSKSLLFFIAGLAAIYSVLITKNKKDVSLPKMANLFASKMKSLVGPIAACTFGYMIGELFADIGATTELELFLKELNLPLVALAFIVPLITAFLGMIIPGSSQVVIFGPVFISAFAAAGANPLFVAAMLPCICGTMCGITPPLALGMYAGMSIAESDFKKTLINDLWWVATQYVLEVIMLLGILPVFGL